MNLRRENCFIDPGGQEERIISQQMNTTSVEISEKKACVSQVFTSDKRNMKTQLCPALPAIYRHTSVMEIELGLHSDRGPRSN